MGTSTCVAEHTVCSVVYIISVRKLDLFTFGALKERRGHSITREFSRQISEKYSNVNFREKSVMC